MNSKNYRDTVLTYLDKLGKIDKLEDQLAKPGEEQDKVKQEIQQLKEEAGRLKQEIDSHKRKR